MYIAIFHKTVNHNKITTVLPVKSDSDVMFCLQLLREILP